MNFLGYEAIMLAFEANGVIGLRLMKIAIPRLIGNAKSSCQAG